MSLATCLVPADALRGEVLSLTGERFHHLFRVRRLGVDAKLRLTDGQGAARWGRVERLRSQEAVVRLESDAESNEAPFRLELWVATLRPRRATWLVEKTTEVGAAAIRWLATDRAGREITAERLKRLRRVAEAAVEQCHRSRVPEISGPHGWRELHAELGPGAAAWFLDTVAAGELRTGDRFQAGALLVGPEGGWSEGERSDLASAGLVAVGLGPRQLRVETAAVAGAALILSGHRA